MFLLVLGVALLVIPYLVACSHDTLTEGFLKIGAIGGLFYLALALFTQFFHVFTYPVVLSFYIVFAVASLLFCTRKFIINKSFSSAFVSTRKTLARNWIFFLALTIIFFQLFSVHHSYTGLVQTLRGQETVHASAYPYPFFSDEWVTVSLINYSISSHSLPVVNPLYYNTPFPNILFAFPSLLAEFFLVTGLHPLTQYSIVSVFFGLLLCASLYILLRSYGVSPYVSAASILAVPYITNSGNLPALWSLLPFTIASILLIWQLIAQKHRQQNYAWLYAALALLIYPPIVVFVVPVLCAGLFRNRAESSARYVLPLLLAAGALLIIFYAVLSTLGITIEGVLSTYLVRPNLDPGIVSYALYNVLPLGVVILAFLGVYRIIKKRESDLSILLAVGLGYWFLYAFINKVFIIEYPRVVVITSFFLIVSAGIALEWLITAYSRPSLQGQIRIGVGISVAVLSLILLPSYTTSQSWRKLVLNVSEGNGQFTAVIPASPVNRYLTEDDLNLFESIHGAGFLAPPWKGLVIGVATGNFPVESKPSTITDEVFPYNEFMSLDCTQKAEAAKEYSISYVYSDPFTCPQFSVIGQSSESLTLYRYDTIAGQ